MINLIDKYLKDKMIIMVTHKNGLKKIASRHFEFKNHVMKEVK